MIDERGAHEPPGRPRFHFTPPAGWLNDPNGLVFDGGEYHLCYQHHPDDDVWGPMHWGHAVSRDLVRWEHLPVALAPDELGWIYSGSAVVDHDGTAGFGRGALVAVFTHASAEGQAQSLAFSCDRGRTWRTDPGNPVLPPPAGEPDFRDPKVFRWSQGGASHWVMVLAAGRRVLVHTSPDLRHWTLSSELVPRIAEEASWETPDLFPLRVDGTGDERWVLSLGVMAGAPSGGTGTGYLVGDFDGHVFTPDGDEVLWADHGPDFYAAQSWNDVPSGERVWIAWMSNWRYADRVPSTGWRGVMTVSRRLGLTRTAGGPRLTQVPVAALDACRAPRLSGHDVVLPGAGDVLDGVRCRHFDLTLRIRVDRSAASHLELHTMVGGDERTAIVYDLAASTLSIDRSRAGTAAFHREHPTSAAAPVEPRDGRVTVRVLGDECSVEVFANDGVASLSALVYPAPRRDGFALRAAGGTVVLETIELFELSP
ncbi:MAG: glycoside hydrolase family 32 protein [Acidimicrobiia bacterium]|nr:glycoside hydrolase family 32 protein [Acidimicrobiia bacterium]